MVIKKVLRKKIIMGISKKMKKEKSGKTEVHGHKIESMNLLMEN